MNSELIENILKIAGYILTVITIIVSIISSKLVNWKIKKDCDKVLTFLFKAQNVISKAEHFLNWTNEERKQYVMAMLYTEGKDCGMDETDVDNLVENLVAFLNQRVKKENKINGTEQGQ